MVIGLILKSTIVDQQKNLQLPMVLKLGQLKLLKIVAV